MSNKSISSQYNRVLFIAPSDAGLDVIPEIDTLQDLGYQVRALQGPVTSERVFQAARLANTHYGILHFACHAGPDGVLLSDNRLFDIDAILQLARLVDAKIVFLNGCSTSTIGQALVDQGVPVAIVAMSDLSDDIMKRTAQTFYVTLAECGDPHQAYKDSKPASRGMYQWLADGGYQELVIGPLVRKINEFEEMIKANMTEHIDMRDSNESAHVELRTLVDSLAQTTQQLTDNVSAVRRFYLRMSIAVVVGVVLVNMIFILIARAP